MAYSDTRGATASYNRSIKRAVMLNQARKYAIEVTMELVHPSYLGTLPPAPRVLLHKAYTSGLLTADEYYA